MMKIIINMDNIQYNFLYFLKKYPNETWYWKIGYHIPFIREKIMMNHNSYVSLNNTILMEYSMNHTSTTEYNLSIEFLFLFMIILILFLILNIILIRNKYNTDLYKNKKEIDNLKNKFKTLRSKILNLMKNK